MLDLNLGVMLIEAGIFLITMILLKKWLFDPLVSFMDEREAKLKRDLEMIEKNSEDTAEIEAEIEKILADARHEARKIIDEARAKALKEAEELKSKKAAEIEAAKEELRKEIEKEKEAIISALTNESNTFKEAIENKIRNVAWKS